LRRAIFGALRVAESRGLRVQQDERFNEIFRGRWVGLTPQEIAEQFPEDAEHFHDPDYDAHGGESYRTVHHRVSAARDDLLRAHPGQTVCLVCHNWVCASIVADVLGIPIEEWRSLKLPTASVSLIEYPSDCGAPRALYVGKFTGRIAEGQI
jgi:probable phosphoglycerate mutase